MNGLITPCVVYPRDETPVVIMEESGSTSEPVLAFWRRENYLLPLPIFDILLYQENVVALTTTLYWLHIK
jgi:hypothetical protein